jgi:glycosyltransferase involved in cell wall biosynthesis
MSGPIILHVGASRYQPLPAQHHTAANWRELARDSGAYHVAARAAGRRGSISVADGVTLHLVGSRLRSEAEFLITGVFLLRLVRELKPAVVLCQCPVFGGIWAYLATRGRPIRFLVELHGEHFFRDRQATLRARILQWLALPALRSATSIRVLSADMKVSVGKTYGTEIASKCVIIPNRVDLQVFGPAKSSYATTGRLRLVTVGSFIPLKNHLELIEAVLAMEGVELTIVGAGPLEPEYRRVIRAANSESRIHLHSWVPQTELAKILARHDAYVHFSRTEALSRAILEAMALGLPVIATEVGFIAGVLEDEQNAFLLRPPWANTLGVAVRNLAASITLREEMGKRGHETILREYEWHAVFARYRAWLATAKPRDTQ